MPLLIECPSGHRLKVPSKHAGHRIVCPVCNRSIAVPPLKPPSKLGPTPNRKQASKDQAPKGPAVDPEQRKSTPKPKVPLLRPVDDPPKDPSEPAEESRQPPVDSTPPVEQSVEEPALQTTGQLEAESVVGTINVHDQAPDLTSDLLPALNFDEHSQHDSPVSHRQPASPVYSDQRWGVVTLGIASVLVAVFCAVPSIVDQVVARQVGDQVPDAWTYLVLLGSLVQITVALYAIRLPDWSTSWVASIIATGFAGMYALALALTMFADQEHQLVHQLGLLDEAFRGRAQPWCFIVMCVTLILAYCYGRFSLRWYQLEKQLATSRRG